MIKTSLITLFFTIFLTTSTFSAGSGGSGGSGGSSDGDGGGFSKTKTQYDMAVSHIKGAKKFEKKDKLKKAKKKYEKAQKLLLKSNIKFPNKADTLNYLGFTTRKLGDYENGEKYYLEGLAIDPSHIGINEYLGELYVVTNRINLAKERLEILKSCNCEEYQDLKDIIIGKKQSKY
jgi:tetratricopeptide (TPR) repeat protein